MDLPNEFEQSGILILFQRTILQKVLFHHLSQVLPPCLHHTSKHSLFVPTYVYETSSGVRKCTSILHSSDLRYLSVICGVAWCRTKDIKMNEEGKQPYHPKIHGAAKLVTQWDCFRKIGDKQHILCHHNFKVWYTFLERPKFLGEDQKLYALQVYKN